MKKLLVLITGLFLGSLSTDMWGVIGGHKFYRKNKKNYIRNTINNCLKLEAFLLLSECFQYYNYVKNYKINLNNKEGDQRYQVASIYKEPLLTKGRILLDRYINGNSPTINLLTQQLLKKKVKKEYFNFLNIIKSS